MAAIDLTTRANVRAFLQKPAGDTAQDAIIDALVTAASRLIMDECEREFAPVTATATRTFSVARRNGALWLDLNPYDLRTVTQVRVDTDTSSPTTLASDEYRLWPRPNKDGTFLAIKLQPQSHSIGRIAWEDREVQVTGAWGFAAVPEDVEMWCRITVAIWLRRDVQAFSTTFSIEEDRLERPEALPSAVRSGLRHYRRFTA